MDFIKLKGKKDRKKIKKSRKRNEDLIEGKRAINLNKDVKGKKEKIKKNIEKETQIKMKKKS